MYLHVHKVAGRVPAIRFEFQAAKGGKAEAKKKKKKKQNKAESASFKKLSWNSYLLLTSVHSSLFRTATRETGQTAIPM